MYHWLFQAQDERKFRKYYNTDMLVWKLRGFLGEIWNWLCTQRTRRDWRKGWALLGWREAGLRTKELHARPVLGGLKMSRSPHPPTRIFEAFMDALMWVISHMDHPDGLNSTLLSQVWSLKMVPTEGTMGGKYTPRMEKTCRASDYSRPTTPTNGHGLLMIPYKRHREDDLVPEKISGLLQDTDRREQSQC